MIRGIFDRHALAWLALACIPTLFCMAVIRLHPTNFFGYTEDDSIYFSSAKGIAEGKGYVLTSFPGTPTATKYPIFYPWLLSWVWRWNPSFPSNLIDAIGITVAFGGLYIGFCLSCFYAGSRTLATSKPLFSRFSAHSIPLWFSTVGACSQKSHSQPWLLPRCCSRKGNATDIDLCRPYVLRPCYGLCILTRTFGVPIAAGIVLAVIRRCGGNCLYLEAR